MQKTICSDKDLLFVPSSLAGSCIEHLLLWRTEKQERKIVLLQDDPFIDALYEDIEGVERQRLHEPFASSFYDIAKCYVFISSELFIPQGSLWPHAELFSRILLHLHFISSEMDDFGALVYRNIKSSVDQGDEAYRLSLLKGALKKYPAIICGAGASLSRQMDSLKELYPHAVIFAGGASIAAMSLASASFHIAAGVDPSPDYGRFLQGAGFEVPFFYQHRFSADILQRHGGPKIAVPSHQGSLLEAWLHRCAPDAFEQLDGGWTVASFLTALALHLGCDPIVFVGVDLGRGDGYALELAATPLDSKEKKEWLLCREWIEEKITSHSDTTFIDASDAGFIGAKKMELSTFHAMVDKGSLDITSSIHACLLRAMQQGGDHMLASAIECLEKSMGAAENIISALIDQFAKSHPDDPTAKGEYILLEHDLSLEMAYEALLEPVWDVWQHVFYRLRLEMGQLKLHQLLFFQKVLHTYLARE